MTIDVTNFDIINQTQLERLLKTNFNFRSQTKLVLIKGDGQKCKQFNNLLVEVW